MALFPNVNTYYKGRTHTQLVVSEGVAPAEKWIPSASETTKFQYAYGPEGNQDVVIPKGKIVALSGMEYDYETDRMVPAIKIATDDDTHVIGVNHHNVYARRRDRFSGNAPTIITREYIELPLFSAESAAMDIQFGAAWYDGDNATPESMLGKFVVSDAYGNATLAGEGATAGQIIGQVLAIETEMPPAGFLQYFLEMQDNEYTDFLKQQSYAPSPGRTSGQGAYDSGTYPLGTSYLESANKVRDWNKGIPRLTDGYFKSRTHVIGIAIDNKPTVLTDPESPYDATTNPYIAGVAYAETDAQYGQITSIKTSGNVEVTAATGTVAASGDLKGAAMFIRLKDKLANDALKAGDTNVYPEFSGTNPANVSVKIGGVSVSDANLHIDYTNNTLVIYFTSAISGRLEITADMLINGTPGIPTGWDFKGAMGAVRILLQR